MTISNLKRYWLTRVLTKWIWLIGLLPLVLDFLTAFIPKRYIPNFILSLLEEGTQWEVTLILFSVGLFISAYLVHRETQIQLSNLVTQQANLWLECSKLVFLHDAPAHTSEGRYQDGLKPNGLPVRAIVSAQIEVHNLGREDGHLDWDLDNDQTVLSNIFHLSNQSPMGSFHGLPDLIEGRARIELNWRLECIVKEENPEMFTQQLVRDNEFNFVIHYRTKKVGQPSDYSSLELRGTLNDYRRELIRGWKKRGLSDLVSIVGSNGINYYVDC